MILVCYVTAMIAGRPVQEQGHGTRALLWRRFPLATVLLNSY